ncbi:MAG: valine--tRNA ligase [Candidatus Improbicoccus devescovinae]|nr:MAG: valine--tRNA ligase [Candidatus Improbicoccus devescovinae]
MFEFDKIYKPELIEQDLYNFWITNNFFVANPHSVKKKYTIMMPPPNITGNLHLGHALDQTIQDILARFKRMAGYEVLFLPGTDHAAIATETKIVQQMATEGLTKKDITREEFLERAWAWKKKYGHLIIEQIKKIGSSCDWTCERFTMDENYTTAITECFVKFYEENLIYRGERIINWCPNCRTSVSDAEVNHTQTDGKLYYIKYYIKNSKNQDFLCVATTRPETIFGDVALAVNPDHDLAKTLIGKSVIVPLTDREIPIIVDASVDPNFGTGILKVTPAHAYEDFEIGRRHNLPILKILDSRGYLNQECGEYQNTERFVAREKIVKDLNAHNFIEKTENLVHNTGHCYRCESTIEPMISTQWFCKMAPLAEQAINIVKADEIQFVPKHFDRIYFQWLTNIKDWCISRQLWWGHRIPAWYCENCEHITISRHTPNACEKCNSKSINQDPDTLDTWFSSALWPFATLGWPKKTKYWSFYPTDTLVTGYDIIFFWVARMIFSSLKLTKKIPFSKVLIHGLVRDAHGQKMSKSLGNGIDPLDVIEKYGADALRFALISGLTPGNDSRFSIEKIEGARRFLNKIWNAARLIYLNTQDIGKNNNNFIYNTQKISSWHNSWILSRFNNLTKIVYENLENFEYGIALQKLYSFFWDEFCDWYLEFAKFDFKISNTPISRETKNISVYILQNTLKLLHPFIPFITEKIYKIFDKNFLTITTSSYPEFHPKFVDSEAEEKINKIITLIKSVRNKRNTSNTKIETKISVYIHCADPIKNILKQYEEIIIFFIRALKIEYSSDIQNAQNNSQTSVIILDFAKIYIPNTELLNTENILSNINKEIAQINSQLEKYKILVNNPEFLMNAKETVISDTKLKLENLEKKLKDLTIEKLKF